MAYFKCGSDGSSVEIDGVPYDGDLKLVSTTTDMAINTLPYNFHNGCAVVLDNKIHILGGTDSNTNHYKYNGSYWVSVSTLPYIFYGGGAVVLNGEIHIMGSKHSSSYYKYHYKNYEVK